MPELEHRAQTGNALGRYLVTGFYVAETFEKRHSDVLRDIEKLECSDEFRERNFALSSYKSVQKKHKDVLETISSAEFSAISTNFVPLDCRSQHFEKSRME